MSVDEVDDPRVEGAEQTTAQGEAMAREADATADIVEGDVFSEAPSVRDHPLVLVVGLAAVLAGVGAALGLGVVPDVPAVTLMNAAASLAVVIGIFATLRGALTRVEQAETDDVEYRGDVTVPGADADALLGRATSGRTSTRVQARRELFERLREVAATSYATAAGIPIETARERVRDGRWTDDTEAAALLAGGTDVSVVDEVRSLVGDRSSLAQSVDRVVAVLEEMAPGIGSASAAGGAATATATDDASEADPPPTHDTTFDEPTIVDRTTGRWTGVAGLALLAVGIGVLNGLGRVPPSLLVAAATLIGAAGYVYLSTPPAVAVRVERDLHPANPGPGDRVTVTTTVTNESDALQPDIRVVDGVPPALRVVEGSPRVATALRPGESVAISYVVDATRGSHAFEAAQVITRDFSGALERERRVRATEPTVLECGFTGGDTAVPVHPHTARQVGRVVTDTGGSGVELHSVREYRRGDPLSRVDWNRLAATGEFATLQFREEHAATVVVLVDARVAAHVAPRVDAPSAIERELEAADAVISSLLADGDSVGLAALSPDWCWLEPRGGTGHLARARDLLATHPAFDGQRPRGGFHDAIEERRLRRELSADAQLVVLSPLCDDAAVSIARGLHVRGFPVTVFSPDATGSRTTGQRLAAVERALRISRLRSAGVRVVDWGADETLAAAIDAAERRWSA